MKAYRRRQAQEAAAVRLAAGLQASRDGFRRFQRRAFGSQPSVSDCMERSGKGSALQWSQAWRFIADRAALF